MQQQRSSSALLLVDLQVGLFDGPEKPYRAEQLLENANLLISKARENGVPIFAARHTGPVGSPIEAGSVNWQLTPKIAFDPARDIVFDKTRPSCFIGTPLLQHLHALHITQLVIAGLKTQYCIDTTCRAAAEHGIQITLIADAHSCMDTPLLPAETIIAHHNATLQGPFVKLADAHDFRFQ
jgi:nicotinamidase-related amidase